MKRRHAGPTVLRQIVGPRPINVNRSGGAPGSCPDAVSDRADAEIALLEVSSSDESGALFYRFPHPAMIGLGRVGQRRETPPDLRISTISWPSSRRAGGQRRSIRATFVRTDYE